MATPPVELGGHRRVDRGQLVLGVDRVPDVIAALLGADHPPAAAGIAGERALVGRLPAAAGVEHGSVEQDGVGVRVRLDHRRVGAACVGIGVADVLAHLPSIRIPCQREYQGALVVADARAIASAAPMTAIVRRCLASLAATAIVLATAPMPVAAALPPGGSFIDDNGSTFEGAIEAIVAEGITSGCGGGRFCPTEAVTRGQMAAFLARALHLVSTSGVAFSDVPTSHPFWLSINRLATAGIATGCGGGRFCPSRP